MVLASASPRRRAILRMLGLEPRLAPAGAVERAYAPPGEPGAHVEAQALAKVRAAAPAAAPEELVIAADTMVVLGRSVLGKPRGPEEAREMLCALSGRTHEVITGVAVARAGRERGGAERTRVRFRRLSHGEVESYVESGEPLDKAGAYGIQDRGASLVRSIDGCFFNVMGLPIARLLELLAALRLGYDARLGAILEGGPDPP